VLGGRGAGLHRPDGALVRVLLIGPDVGHIPISNLYEVFVLFCLITALFYLYYEERYATRGWVPSC
jgi:ABC-type transport system involved in cytochrome c biogenesis permease subunit